jgi:hypothetical protein
MTETEVWWAALGDARERHVALLNPIERGRRERYVQREDQDRFTLGVAMSSTHRSWPSCAGWRPGSGGTLC